jgi:protein SCO1/2
MMAVALRATPALAALGDGQAAAPTQIGIVEKLGRRVPGDLGFIDAGGDSVYLRDALDKPAILTLVYYHCPSICKPLLGALAEVVEKTDLEPGTDYDVITVSFDETDTPASAASIRDNVTNAIHKPIATGGWEFLTADSATIARLTEAVGFGFERREQDFAHSSALIVLTAEGKIIRYLYGRRYLPFDLKMAVAEARKGNAVPSIANVLQYCFSDDPEGRSFVMNFNRMIGTGIVLFAVGWVLYMRSSRSARATAKRRRKDEA